MTILNLRIGALIGLKQLNSGPIHRRVTARQKFSSQADPELLAGMREAARKEGRHFQAVLEDAMRGYIESRNQARVRPEVMAHYRASVEKNRLLAELLAK